MRLEQKVALITGGGSGIGQAIAERFAREGARVVVADLVTDRAERVTADIRDAGGEALAVTADVTDAAAVARMVEAAEAAFGQIDILVNNAGGARGDDIREIDEATWDWNIDLVLKGPFLCSKAVVPGMIERRSGSIVMISSVNGLTGLGEEAYGAGKAGLINLAQNMAVKYGRYGVRVNSICPGTVRTPIWQPRIDEDPQIFDRLAAWYPMGRVGEPEDVANAALFLASDEASWITGVTLPVDGGLLAGTYRMGRELLAKSADD